MQDAEKPGRRPHRTGRVTTDGKGGEKQEGTAKTAAGRKCGGRTETIYRSHSMWKNAEKDSKEQPEPQHAEKRKPKGKEKVEPQPEPQEKANPKDPRKAGGGEHTRIG